MTQTRRRPRRASTGDRILDGALGITSTRQGKKPKDVVEALERHLRTVLYALLVAEDILRAEGSKVIGLSRASLAGRHSRARGGRVSSAHAGADAMEDAGSQGGGARFFVARPQVGSQDRRPEGVQPDPHGAPGDGEGALGERLGV